MTFALLLSLFLVVAAVSARRRLSGWSKDESKKQKKGNDCDRRRLGGKKQKKDKKPKKSHSKKSHSKKSKSNKHSDDYDDDCGNGYWSTDLPYSTDVDDDDDAESTSVGIECPETLWDADDSTPCECFTGINLEGCDISRCSLTDTWGCTTPDSSAQLNSQQAQSGGIAAFAGSTTGAGVISGLVLMALLALIGAIISCVCYRKRRKAAYNVVAMDLKADEEGAAVAPETTANHGDIAMTALPDGEASLLR